MTNRIPCRPHPDSRVCMLQGHHLTGCNLHSCNGCVACEHHHTTHTEDTP